MKQNIFFRKLFAVIILLSIAFLAGCEKKTEQKPEEVKGETISTDTSSSMGENTGGETPAEKITIPDLKGTWAGTFDKRATTFKITEQTDSSFSGKITINYRQVINQEVKGTFSPSTLKMRMTDQLHSRFEGSYSGKLSKELNNFSGTFAMKLDGSKFSFNLNKK